MSKRQAAVARPVKKAEYRIEHHTNQSAKGWVDLLASFRNATTEAWDRLTRAPLEPTERQYTLKGDYATVSWQGRGIRPLAVQGR